MSFSSEEKNKQLAAFLKEQRIKQKLTIEDIVMKTGVPDYHLKAIELGTFEKFDAFYLKMYIKKYAEILEINSDELLEQYLNVQPTAISQSRLVAKSKSKSVHQKPKNSFSIIMIVVGSLLIGSQGLSLVFKRMESMDLNEGSQVVIDNPNSNELLPTEDEKLDEQTELEDGLVDKSDMEVETEAETEVEMETEVILESAGNSNSIYSVSSISDTINLKLTFNEPCWLAITQLNQNLVDATIYDVGDVIELEMNDFNNEVLLNIGNINATVITVDEVVIESELTIPHQYITLNLKK